MSVLSHKQRGWTTGEVKKLRQLWDMGCTADEIGEALGRSRNSICSAARRYQLPSRGCPIPKKVDLVRQRQEELGRMAAIQALLKERGVLR
jgi:hypothetical protein